MIKFFRHIRKTLLNEGKTGKYFKYAVGEIVLVVIGILIALQINTWKENKKQQIVLENYYIQILDDFKQEKEYITRITNFLDSSMDSYNNYLNKYDSVNLKSSDLIGYLRQIEFTSLYLKFNTTTIETVQNTGEIKLFPESIRNRLTELKQNQESIVIVNNGNNEIYLKSLMNATNQGLYITDKRTKNHPKLEHELTKEISPTKMILAAETAFGLKNFTESLLKTKLENILIEIEELEELIIKELNQN